MRRKTNRTDKRGQKKHSEGDARAFSSERSVPSDSRGEAAAVKTTPTDRSGGKQRQAKLVNPRRHKPACRENPPPPRLHCFIPRETCKLVALPSQTALLFYLSHRTVTMRHPIPSHHLRWTPIYANVMTSHTQTRTEGGVFTQTSSARNTDSGLCMSTGRGRTLLRGPCGVENT